MSRIRIALTVTLLTLPACYAFAQDDRLQQNVNENFGCLPLADLMPKLTKKTGIKFEVEAASEGWMLFLDVKNRPLAEIMNRIAAIFDMTWMEEGLVEAPRYTLKHNAEQKKRLEAARRQPLLDAIKSAKDFLASYDQARKLSPQERKTHLDEYLKMKVEDRRKIKGDIVKAVQLCSYPFRSAIEIASAWKDDDWQQLIENGALVYSSKPTSLQRLLPSYDEDEAIEWRKRCQAGQREDPYAMGIESTWYDESGKIVKSFEGQPIDKMKIRFVYGDDSGFTLDASLLNKEGEHMAVMIRNEILAHKPFLPPMPCTTDDPIFKVPCAIEEKLRRLNDEGLRDFAKYYGHWVRSHSKEDFLEPMAVGLAPILSILANATDRSWILPVADESLYHTLPAQTKTVADVLQSFFPILLRLDKKDPWILGELKNPALVSELDATADRNVLRRICRELYPDKALSFDTMADVTRRCTQQQIAWTSFILARCFDDLATGQWSDVSTIAFMRLWASLTPTQKGLFKANIDGASISVLTPEQLLLASRCMRGSSWDFLNDPTEKEISHANSKIQISFYFQPSVPYAIVMDDLSSDGYRFNQARPPTGRVLVPGELAKKPDIAQEGHGETYLYPAVGWNGWASIRDMGAEASKGYLKGAFFGSFRIHSRQPLDYDNPDPKLERAIKEAKREEARLKER